jgi:hypothetical protein
MAILINTAIHRGASRAAPPETVSTVSLPGEGKRLKPLRAVYRLDSTAMNRGVNESASGYRFGSLTMQEPGLINLAVL